MLEIYLTRNLRKAVKQGHPWIFKDAVAKVPERTQAQICKILDSKNEFVAWGLYNPEGTLSLRILGLDKKAPDRNEFYARMLRAYQLRRRMFDEQTTAFRLFNGEGDFLPGLVCDVYGEVAVVQYDGFVPRKFWRKYEVQDWLLRHTHCNTVVVKPRANDRIDVEFFGENLKEQQVEILENGRCFLVDVIEGQKTGFFLDQRENRNYVASQVKGLIGLNVFSYTGGFSIYAGTGNAKQVTSLDLGSAAIDLAQRNWEMNGLDPSFHRGISTDAFKFLKETKDKWDFVIVDPPSLTHGDQHKQMAIKKYIEVFSLAAKKVKPGGHLFISSCSSRITFEDFGSIATECLSVARRRGQVLRISGQGRDHPFPHACQEFRYLKFMHFILD